MQRSSRTHCLLCVRKVCRAARLASWIPGFLRGSFYEVEAILRRRRQQFMAASAEELVPNALQVMSPNATATQEVLRGNVEANHESVGGLVNGVAAAPLQDGLPTSGIQVETVNPLSSGGVVATQEQVNVPMNEAIHAVVPGQGQALSTPNVALEDGSVRILSVQVFSKALRR